MKEIDIRGIQQVINDHDRFIVTSHGAPDGDSVGSTLALYLYLKSTGKDVQVVIPDDAPRFLHWMPGYEDINFHVHKKEHCEDLVVNADVIFCLDFNFLNRLYLLSPCVEASNAIKVVIDHHRNPDSFSDHIISEPGTSSTAEMIYELISLLSGDTAISVDIATCIYTGIMTDTGSFKYSCTSSDTHKIAAALIEKGINNEDIFDNIYGDSKKETIELLGYCLSEKMVVMEEFRTAYMSLDKKEMQKYKFEKGDTEGFVNYGLSIKGIRFVAFFMTVRDVTKISFRSIGDFSTEEFAREHFNGGGHTNASGGFSTESIQDTIEEFKSLLPRYKEKLNQP